MVGIFSLNMLFELPWTIQKWWWDSEKERWEILTKHFDKSVENYGKGQEWLREELDQRRRDLQYLKRAHIKITNSLDDGNEIALNQFTKIKKEDQIYYIMRENHRWKRLHAHFEDWKVEHPGQLLWLLNVLENRNKDIDKLCETYMKKHKNDKELIPIGVKPMFNEVD